VENIEGGTITSNICKSGEVVIVSGTFTMQDGTISGNTVSKNDDGVYISGGTFNM